MLFANDFPFLEPTDSPDHIGAIGNYLIERLVGQGSNCFVFAGIDPKLRRRIALRVLKPALSESQESREQFLAESRAGSGIEHHNLLPVYEVCGNTRWPYAVVAYNDGPTLEEWAQSEGELAFEEIRRLGSEIARGLHALHENAIIHGDLKPSNVLLEKASRTARLADFGGPPGRRVTLSFASPEQVDGLPLDHRSDLFALGVLLYKATTGKLPYQTSRSEALAREIAFAAPPPIDRASIPSWFQCLVACLLEKAPSDRPQSAMEVVHALETSRFRQPTTKRANQWLIGAGWVSLLTLIVLLFFLAGRSENAQESSVVIEGSGLKFNDLSFAIAAAPAGATLVLSDALYEVGGPITIKQPIKLIASDGAHPLIRSKDTVAGTLFRTEAVATFEGLTLSHHLSDPFHAGSLIRASAPLTIIRCRMEQIWKGSPKAEPFPMIINTTESVRLVRTEIDASAGCAIMSSITKKDQEVSIHIEECAIAAVRGLYLNGAGRATRWRFSISNSNIVAGGLFCFQENGQSVPHWSIENCVLDCAHVLMVRGEWQTYAQEILTKATWAGRKNLIASSRFLYPWEGGPEDPKLTETVKGWLTLCPDAQEIDSESKREPWILPTLPEGYREMRSLFQGMPAITAMDLRLNDSSKAGWQGHGGDMLRVGPHAER